MAKGMPKTQERNFEATLVTLSTLTSNSLFGNQNQQRIAILFVSFSLELVAKILRYHDLFKMKFFAHRFLKYPLLLQATWKIPFLTHDTNITQKYPS